MNQPLKPEKITGNLREVGPYLGLGTGLAGTIIVFILVGNWLDGKYGTNHWVWILGFIGMASGLYNFIRTVTDLEKRNKQRKKEAQEKK